MGSMTVLAVEPLREKVYQFVEHLFSDHTYIEFKKNEEEEDSQIRTFNPDDYPRKPKWIPEGYSLSFEDDVPEVFSFAQVYWNGDKQIVYEQIAMEYSDGWGMTSDGTPAEEIMIGDRKAYMLTDEGGYHNIILEEDGFAYCVGGNVNVDVEILVKCFESVFEEESVE